LEAKNVGGWRLEARKISCLPAPQRRRMRGVKPKVSDTPRKRRRCGSERSSNLKPRTEERL